MAYAQYYSRETSNENGQDGQETGEVKDFGVSNDFRKASSLRTSTEMTNKHATINGIEKGITRNDIEELKETTDRNVMTNGTTKGTTGTKTNFDETMIDNELEGTKSGNESDLSSKKEDGVVSSRKRSMELINTNAMNNGIGGTDRTKQQHQTNADTNITGIRFIGDVEINRNQEETSRTQVKTARAKSLGIASGWHAKETRMETDALKVGPG